VVTPFLEHSVETLVFESNSPETTAVLAAAYARVIEPGTALSLEGDLGAGKTLFTRALVQALGSADSVASPTFVLQRIYATAASLIRRVFHYDLYRIGTYHELQDLGFEELPDDGIAVVEWGEKLADQFPMPVSRIAFEVTGDETRRITFTVPAAAAGQLKGSGLRPA
jgi:tRNA threonylcarbamoyladenosine biosynthesis protein TsaE